MGLECFSFFFAFLIIFFCFFFFFFFFSLFSFLFFPILFFSFLVGGYYSDLSVRTAAPAANNVRAAIRALQHFCVCLSTLLHYLVSTLQRYRVSTLQHYRVSTLQQIVPVSPVKARLLLSAL
jgi:hypothetical protein